MNKAINNFRNNYYYYILLFFVFSFFWNIQISTFLLVLLSLIWIFDSFKGLKENLKIFKNPLFYLTSITWLWSVVGLFYSSDFDHGIFILGVSACMIVCPIVFYSVSQKEQFLTKKQIRRIFYFFAVGSSSTALFCLVKSYFNQLSNPELNALSYTNLIHVPLSPGSLGNYVVFTLIVLLLSLCNISPFQEGKSKKTKLTLCFLILFNLLFLFLLQAKAAILAFVAVLVVLVIYVFFKRFNVIKALVICFCFFIIGGGFLLKNGLEVFGSRFDGLLNTKKEFSKTSNTSNNLRLSAIHGSLYIIKNNFWFGVGTGAVKSELTRFYHNNGYTQAEKHKTDTHNQILRSFAKHGVFGLLTVLIVFLVPFYLGLKYRSILFVLFGVLQLVVAQAGDLLDNQPGIVFHSFLTCFLVFIYLPKHKNININ